MNLFSRLRIVASAGVMAVMFTGCGLESQYDRITGVKFARGWGIKSLTESDAQRVPQGCMEYGESTPEDVKLGGVVCSHQANGSSKPDGHYFYLKPTESPANIFKSVVAVLKDADALDFTEDSGPSEDSTDDSGKYIVTIDLGSQPKTFTVNATSSRKLDPQESAIIDLWMRLQTAVGSKMTQGVVL
jgi:hypothetical protein